MSDPDIKLPNGFPLREGRKSLDKFSPGELIQIAVYLRSPRKEVDEYTTHKWILAEYKDSIKDQVIYEYKETISSSNWSLWYKGTDSCFNGWAFKYKVNQLIC